mgnify:CR=1 FL=1
MSLVKANGAGEVSTGFYDYEIQNSMLFNGSGGLRFNSAEAQTSYWNLSVWIKRHKLGGNYSTIMSATNYGSTYQTDVIGFGSANTMYSIRGSNANSFTGNSGTAIVRDTSNWYHYCLRNSGGTVTRWLNGVQDSSYSISGTFIGIGRSGNHDIGAYGGSSASYNNNFSLADFYFINDSSFGASDVYDYTQFAEFKNGVLVPKKNSLTAAQIGDGGFFLQFQQTGGSANSSGIGADTSGNDHHLSVIGTVSDHCKARLDTPTNNWCTLDPNFRAVTANTLSEGNGKCVTSTSGRSYNAGTFRMTTGKWYWEFRPDANSGGMGVAKINGTNGSGAYQSQTSTSTSTNTTDYYYGETNWAMYGDGIVHNASYVGGTSSGMGSPSYPQIWGIGIDLDSDPQTITYYIDGSSVGSASLDSGFDYIPIVGDGSGGVSRTIHINFGQNPTFNGNETAGTNSDANGNGLFHDSVPSGYLALCSANQPKLTIGPAQSSDASDFFNSLLYTGDGSSSRNITGVGFQPDWVWIAQRNNSSAKVMYDSNRGVNKMLRSDSTAAEDDSSIYGYLSAFGSDGFTLTAGTTNNNYTNENSKNIVAWNWKANGGTTSSNGDGSKTSTVQANQTAGFSIVLYSGDTSSFTVGHGLNSAPEWVIVKSRTHSERWAIFHTSISDQYIYLNETFAGSTGNADERFGNSTSVVVPNSTVVTLGANNSDVSKNGENYVMYCFHSVEGYSKFGSYTGNGSSDGAFVYTGFKPAWLLLKSSSSAGDNWFIFDNKRDVDNVVGSDLNPDSSAAEATSTYMDFLSNGFKLRTTSGAVNDATIFIYMAFAEQPFKFSNAR